MELIAFSSMVWPLIKLGIVFLLIMLLLRLRRGLGTSILSGSLVLAVLFGMDFSGFLLAVKRGMSDPKMLYLIGIVSLILVLSEAMEKSGQSARLMDSLSGLLRFRRLKLAFFPALIGLLPMPGGAVFSAPMVKSVSSDLAIPGESKVLVNYWFRHIWELVWPLYPGLILAAYLADVPLLGLIGVTWPSLPLALFLGWVFFLRPRVLPLPPPSSPAFASNQNWSALHQGLPLLTALGGALALEGFLWVSDAPIPYEAGLLLALFLSIVCTAVQNRLGVKKLYALVSKKHLGRMVFLLLAIFLFKQILEDGGVVAQLSAFARGGSALVAVCLLLPFLVGLISGITIAYVGATFPLILGLLAHGNIQEMPFLTLSLFSGFTGILASPIHVCLLLSCEYFHIPLGRIWKRLALPCLLFLAGGFGYFLVLRSFL